MELSKSAGRVQAVLDQHGLSLKVVEMKDSTRTAQDAADALGCKVGQIAKSLIFKGKETQQPILVIASGANRVNEKKLTAYAGEPVGKADADFALEATGYVIGGIPPVGHSRECLCLIDQDLFIHDTIWAAAGTPNAVFELTPDELLQITGGKVVGIL